MKTPCMTASDKTFAWGRVGLGTFDDTANRDDVRLRGVKAGAAPVIFPQERPLRPV
jgi:hypothetical protein